MLYFEHQSARATLRPIEGGVIEVNYYGVLSHESLRHLKREILPSVAEAPALVIRMDKALIVASSVETPAGWSVNKNIPLAALIVRPEHFEMWVDYSHRVALVGVMRAVFLISQLDLAYRWARGHALAVRSISPQSQHCKQPFA
jgi:hypothetical protein